MPPRKLVLVVVDSLRTETLERGVREGAAPTFAKLLRRGELVRECSSSFPSVTPVASAEIATGVRPEDHWISGMNWYHRAECRYVEYGSSWEATRAFGVLRTTYDTVYNMNMGHLSHEVETVFERLAGTGVRTACTPYLIYRGRRRHELGLEGLMRRVAVAANFRHAVWGPDELFYGELYASRRVPCRPTLARPGTRDEYSACVAEQLVAEDLYDFMLFSLPDHDFHSHRLGPDASLESLSHADASLDRLFEAGGGIDSFLSDHAVIVLADHGQTQIERPLPLATALGEDWRVLQPNADQVGRAELAVSPTARAGGVYVLAEGRAHARTHAAVRERLRETDGVELVAWLAGPRGAAPERPDPGRPPTAGLEACVARRGAELRFRPGSAVRDGRGAGWDLDGDVGVLEATAADGRFGSGAYPDALGRLWSALTAPHAADVLVSCAPGYECVDWGGSTHVGGGSHGSLHRSDSLGPLLTVGVDADPDDREQWSLRDVSDLVVDHFEAGVGTDRKVVAA